jgi:hypothetical protein
MFRSDAGYHVNALTADGQLEAIDCLVSADGLEIYPFTLVLDATGREVSPRSEAAEVWLTDKIWHPAGQVEGHFY